MEKFTSEPTPNNFQSILSWIAMTVILSLAIMIISCKFLLQQKFSLVFQILFIFLGTKII
jgi:predicted membrane channel-forming protein YqfA (hemolysin III family)